GWGAGVDRAAPQTCQAPPLGPPSRPPRTRGRRPDRARHRSTRHPRPRHLLDPDPVAEDRRTRPAGPGPDLAGLPAPVRHRTHPPVPQTAPGLDHPGPTHPRTSRPVDLDHRRRLHPDPPRPPPDHRPPAALGKTPHPDHHHPHPRPTRFSQSRPHPAHPDQTTKTLPTRPRTPTRQPQPATGSPTPSDHQRPPTTQTLNPQPSWRYRDMQETATASGRPFSMTSGVLYHCQPWASDSLASGCPKPKSNG